VSFHHRTVKQRVVALEVRHPQAIRLAGAEVALDEVRVPGGAAVPSRGPDALRAQRTPGTGLAHQPGGLVTADIEPARLAGSTDGKATRVVHQQARKLSLCVTLVPAEQEPPEPLRQILERLGHEVVVCHDLVGSATALDDADVVIALVALVSTDALDLLARIVDTATCPVIAVLRAASPELVRSAATLGVFDVVFDDHQEDLSSALDVTLQRFDAYRARHGASGPHPCRGLVASAVRWVADTPSGDRNSHRWRDRKTARQRSTGIATRRGLRAA